MGCRQKVGGGRYWEGVDSGREADSGKEADSGREAGCVRPRRYLPEQCQLPKARSLANAGELIVLVVVDGALPLLYHVEVIPCITIIPTMKRCSRNCAMWCVSCWKACTDNHRCMTEDAKFYASRF